MPSPTFFRHFTNIFVYFLLPRVERAIPMKYRSCTALKTNETETKRNNINSKKVPVMRAMCAKIWADVSQSRLWRITCDVNKKQGLSRRWRSRSKIIEDRTHTFLSHSRVIPIRSRRRSHSSNEVVKLIVGYQHSRLLKYRKGSHVLLHCTTNGSAQCQRHPAPLHERRGQENEFHVVQ